MLNSIAIFDLPPATQGSLYSMDTTSLLVRALPPPISLSFSLSLHQTFLR
ncbi:hypothetical protein OK016_24025 [Vibrio chagasii]|nr:hypothetical protein [Vibrio chagasii]